MKELKQAQRRNRPIRASGRLRKLSQPTVNPDVPVAELQMERCPADESHFSMNCATHVHPALSLLLLACVGLQLTATAQTETVRARLGTEQVVENLVRMNAERARALSSYQGRRIYRLEYHGFPRTCTAEMVVDVKYESPGTKEFIIQSESGSKVIIDRVFKKLLQSEKEALDAENLWRTTLNEENYAFTLLGYESTPDGSMYILSVEPRRKDKFLYSGTIWVEGEDFAVVRIEAEPAKNPSLWISNTKVEHVYVKVNEFWLPAWNHSLTSVRLGGRADLTIEYKDYQVTATSLPSKFNPVTSGFRSTSPSYSTGH